MKKITIIITIVILFLTGCYSNIDNNKNITSISDNNDNSSIVEATPLTTPKQELKLEEIKAIFKKSNNDVSNASTLIDEAFEGLEDILKNPLTCKTPSKDISNLSEYMSIIEYKDSRLIQYKQTPELFGNSGRGTWQLFQYKQSTSAYIIEKNTTVDIDFFRVIDTQSKHTLYIYGINHQTNIPGIVIGSYEFDSKEIDFFESKIEFDGYKGKQWKFDISSNLLYSPIGMSPFIEAISDNGDEVTIKGVSTNPDVSNEILKLTLGSSGFYGN